MGSGNCCLMTCMCFKRRTLLSTLHGMAYLHEFNDTDVLVGISEPRGSEWWRGVSIECYAKGGSQNSVMQGESRNGHEHSWGVRLHQFSSRLW